MSLVLLRVVAELLLVIEELPPGVEGAVVVVGADGVAGAAEGVDGLPEEVAVGYGK